MTNFLFWLQIVMAWAYAVPLGWHILLGKTGGLTLIVFVVFLAYMSLSLSLALASYREKPDKIRKQTVIIYLQWVVLNLILCILGARSIGWRPGDTSLFLTVGTLSALTLLKYRGMKDPLSRAFLSVWCKGLPQLWLAYTLFSSKMAVGLPLTTLVAGHITGLPRLGQVYLSGRTGGWDRATLGLLIGEAANAASWMIVTVVWTFIQAGA